MAKENNKQNPEEQPQAHPNRDAYAKMFAEDYPDIDFEDKEARYGKMSEDRQRYRELSESGRGLSQALSNNRWIGAMFQDLAKNPDQDPITWMYAHGVDVNKAFEDEEYRDKASKALLDFEKNQSEGEKNRKAAEQECSDNLEQSMNNLRELQQEEGFDDDEANKIWDFAFGDVLGNMLKGLINKETFKLLRRGMNYDGDMANAREEAGIQARNEKIKNGLKTFDEETVPPSFSQGTASQQAPKPKKTGGFFDDLKNYH